MFSKLLTFAILFSISFPAWSTSKVSKQEQQFRVSIAEKLHDCLDVLRKAHAEHGSDPTYIASEIAYHEAIGDLEDYEGGNTTLSHQRLENDTWEVWFDLAPLRDTSDIAIGSDPRPY